MDLNCIHGASIRGTRLRSGTNDLRDLFLRYSGQRICVMGGAASLAEDLRRVEADVYISTNAHGVDLVKPDYILAMDEQYRIGGVPMGRYLRARSGAPIISPHDYADIRIGQWPQQPRWVLSGMIGIWVAFVLGAGVVIVVGCDAYNGEPGYINEARKIARDVHCPVRVVGGQLMQVWPQYDPAERFGEYAPHSAIDGWFGKDGRIEVRVRKPCLIGGIDRACGETLTTWRQEVRLLLKHRMIEEI